jgi:hypothetical protein
VSRPDLHLEVVDDEIIVTLPGASYTVTYHKPAELPQLLAKDFPRKDDSRANNPRRVPRSCLEARQRQGARAGVDCVGATQPRRVPRQPQSAEATSRRATIINTVVIVLFLRSKVARVRLEALPTATR